MKLELNTNGAWRVVLTGLSRHDKAAEDSYLDARTAAAMLADLSNPTRERRGGISWRLVDERGRVVARCSGDGYGWVDAQDRVKEEAA